MRSGLVALGLVGAALAGCGFHRAGLADDGGVDEGGSGSDSCMTFASLLDTCQLAFDRNLTITGAATYDSMTHTLMIGGGMATASITMVMIDGEPVDVISAQKVSVAASSTLRATGPRALAIVASDSLVVAVDSQINVSDGGAGARTSCPGGATAGANNADGAGGGGGGGFGADGGPGGEGDFDHGLPFVPGGAKGNAVAPPAGLHGGCPGGNGGNGDALGGAGGGGGGAIYLVAGNLIQLDSTAPVNAGGGGGRGGVHDQAGGDAGGGGGGSGGTVILEAPHIMGASAVIAANGGGGGEGSDAGGSTGVSGAPGTVTASRASGGAGNAGAGADGGRGGSSEAPAGEVVTAVLNGGGGGGGGGVGIIRILSGDAHLPPASPIAHTN